jgi:hypothetical protein
MTFTKTPPTTPGFYAWRDSTPGYQSEPNAVELYDSAGRLFAEKEGKCYVDTIWKTWTGEWCRLVPAEEVEKAHYEGWQDREFRTGPKDTHSIWYAESRAKRVAEGVE